MRNAEVFPKKGERDSVVVPVLIERLAVETHSISRARVQIRKRVETREEIVDIPTVTEHVHVERIAINKLLNDIVPEIREENGVLIIPLIEEVAEFGKQLMLREEVRISKTRSETITSRKLVLRREVVDVVRQELDHASPADYQSNVRHEKE